MPDDLDLRAMARRVVGRVLSERARVGGELGMRAADVTRPAGVHVVVEPEGAAVRPASPPKRDAKATDLVTAEDLRSTPDGGQFASRRGSILTELAREEAWRRRIAIVEGEPTPGGPRRSDARCRIALGADHGGFELKQALIELLREQGHVLIDLGAYDGNTVDYPDFARAVAEAVADGRADVGICIDGAGIGSAMAANKVPGVRAANGFDVPSAKNAREHNYANFLTLGGRRLSQRAAREIVEAFLGTPWGEERHGRRVEKINAIERHYSRTGAAVRAAETERRR